MFYNMPIIIDIILQGRGVIAPKSLTPLSSKSMGRQPIAVSDISMYLFDKISEAINIKKGKAKEQLLQGEQACQQQLGN